MPFGRGWFGGGFGRGFGMGYGAGQLFGRGNGWGARLGYCPWTGMPRGWRWYGAGYANPGYYNTYAPFGMNYGPGNTRAEAQTNEQK